MVWPFRGAQVGLVPQQAFLQQEGVFFEIVLRNVGGGRKNNSVFILGAGGTMTRQKKTKKRDLPFRVALLASANAAATLSRWSTVSARVGGWVSE